MGASCMMPALVRLAWVGSSAPQPPFGSRVGSSKTVLFSPRLSSRHIHHPTLRYAKDRRRGLKGVRLLYPLQVSRWPLHRARAHPQCRWVLSPGSVASCRLQVRIEAPPFFLVRPFRRRFENRSATRRRACARSGARGSSAGARGLVAWRLELLGHTASIRMVSCGCPPK